jgi:predicted transcriptional regulator
MSLSSECSPPQGGRAVLLSVKPRYSELIVAGSKRVEFRRVWAAEPVRWVAVYSSSPAQVIVGIVEVESVVVATPTALWQLNGTLGGGLTRDELRSYFAGRRQGFALLLGRRFVPPQPIVPAKVVPTFRAPQSFRYLTETEAKRIARSIKP